MKQKTIHREAFRGQNTPKVGKKQHDVAKTETKTVEREEMNKW